MSETPGLTVRELSDRSGVSVASIKFYLREKLLAPGDLQRPGRAYYDERHVDRLALIRALRDVGHLSIEGVRSVVDMLDARSVPTREIVPQAMDAVTRGPRPASRTHGRDERRAQAEVESFLRGRGIHLRSSSAALESLVDGMLAIRNVLGAELAVEELGDLIDLISGVARHEVESTREALLADPEVALEAALVGTVLWEPVLIALRRILLEHYAMEILAGGDGASRSKAATESVSPRRGARRRRRP